MDKNLESGIEWNSGKIHDWNSVFTFVQIGANFIELSASFLPALSDLEAN